ncbi:ankyrin repeat family protein [Fowlpox virus]|uniref:Putative ankyrin repeat protein FPV224 n=2 Tax=Fowlpox virus TaxID=10261 RepID=V224_FOWPN|nr:Ankyrin repeat gene family protein [Fowlpox virus]Q9J511.1 RecName: Full=Putative ankyrin repeat protein FPV224 [Fowlpox virus strain NVSL]UNS14462.1 ALPV-298 [Albatrosspox virus]WPD91034.1 ankyrin repeat family protein [Avipoxvirus sp.]CAE52759.1 putative ankyrin-repeat protein [Fowlpox virus isolate HP-438/Munich]AAF44568.1 ORF FPV224 Ankyrin repeat gene family protein [Fowlpox virus]ART91657.1 ankyrin repeat family protein [Fowlpox virus]
MNINATDNSLSTPLHHAINLLKTDIVSLLMQYKADASIRDSKGITPFCYAMYLGYYGVNKDILNIITRYNSINGTTRDINDVYTILLNNKKKNYVFVNLHDAARLGYVYILKKIIYNGKNINRIDEYYYSALHYAVKSSNLKAVNF